MSFTDKSIKNPTGTKLCISHKIKLPLPEDPPLKSYCPNKSNYKNYLALKSHWHQAVHIP